MKCSCAIYLELSAGNISFISTSSQLHLARAVSLIQIKLLFHFHHQVAQLDQELVRVTALQVVFDLLLTFGLEAFKVNASVPELEHVEPSINSSEQEKSDNEDEENEEGEDDDDKRDDDDVEESQARDTDTAASVLTILTGILESEVKP